MSGRQALSVSVYARFRFSPRSQLPSSDQAGFRFSRTINTRFRVQRVWELTRNASQN